MPGMVNLPSARVTAAYAVPDGPCSATTRAPSSGAPEESVTTTAIAAVVTPWASSAAGPPTVTVAKSTQVLNNQTNVFITRPQTDSIPTGWSGRGNRRPPPTHRQAQTSHVAVTA